MYWPQKGEHDNYGDEPNGRDYTLGYDSNKIEQKKIIEHFLQAFDLELSEENIRLAKSTAVADLTEYGRVVHGEMEAILSCARNSISCRGATLYVTTFPCHNCAKHIIAAGIKRVVYIEPYPKSKAFDFYAAELSDEVEQTNKVVFAPFIGVGPQRYTDLFAMSSAKWYPRKRKDKEGKRLKWLPDEAELRTPIALMSVLEAEEAAVMAFEDETTAIEF